MGIDGAPDVLAEIMTVAWRRAADVPLDRTEARMWLFGVARMTIANASRGEIRRRRLADRLRSVTAMSAATAPSADAGLEVRDALDRLPSDLAQIVRLVHWDGFTLAEVAQFLEEPASTVRSRYRRACDALASALLIGARSQP
ncbi:RNA polymerase sigma-70 factor (ECF subfamily) [Cellulomonas sp. PhB150]|nr:RNA polymerase sigma-70 factor (ECF subfamily) [Cellulomonas sp. PhB150]